MKRIKSYFILKQWCLITLLIFFTGWVYGKKENCDFWGTAKIRHLNVGSNHTITVYDKTGGEIESDLYYIGGGNYAMHVLGEPADLEGTPITFYIDGEEAKVVAGDNIWNEKESKKCHIEVPYPLHSCHFWACQPDSLNEGDSLHVYDTTGFLCGKGAVSSAGSFSLYVAGDDSSTMDIDEGAEEGELLRFTLNGDSIMVLGVSSNNDSVVVVNVKATFNAYTSKRVQLEIEISGFGDKIKPYKPQSCYLVQNYPNPFNATTVIDYRLSVENKVRLVIYNIRGEKVKTLVSENRSAGLNSRVWDGCDDRGKRAPSGVYLYHLYTDDKRMIKKMVLIY